MADNAIISSNTAFSQELAEKTERFISRFEGCVLEAYKPTKNDVLTIGFGHTKNVKKGDKITPEQAHKFLTEDLKPVFRALKSVKVLLSDNEKIALSSFIYNVGTGAFLKSTLLKKLNLSNRQGAALEFEKWVYQKGVILKGLQNRRREEKKMFLSKPQ